MRQANPNTATIQENGLGRLKIKQEHMSATRENSKAHIPNEATSSASSASNAVATPPIKLWNNPPIMPIELPTIPKIADVFFIMISFYKFIISEIVCGMGIKRARTTLVSAY